MLETHPLTPGSTQGDRTADRVPMPIPESTDTETGADVEPTVTTEEPPETTPMPDMPGPMRTMFSTIISTVVSPGGSSTVVTVTTIIPGSSTTGSTTDDEPTGIPTAQSPSKPSKDDGNRIIDNPTALATVFLSSLIAGMALLAIAYVIFRRYRRKAIARQGNGPEQVGIGVWVQRSGERLQAVSELQGSSPTTWDSWRTRAELGTGGPTPELNARWPLGTRSNPAELDSGEVGTHSRWSWISHVSTKLSVQSKKSTQTRPGNRAASRRTLSTASDSSASSMSSTSSLTSEKALLSVFNPRNQRK